MDPHSPLSPAQITQATAHLRGAVSHALSIEEARLTVTITRQAKPPKGAQYGYEVQVRIDGAPPTDAQNAPIAGLIQSVIDNAVRWASAN